MIELLEQVPSTDGGWVVAEETFAARLKQLREAAGLSQAELAERCGMHRFGIAKMEQGQREPSLVTAQTLAKALGVELDAFADTVPTPKDKKKPRGKAGRPPKPAGGQTTPPAEAGEEKPQEPPARPAKKPRRKGKP